jgi:raffinose/stachyose/melibiose transport system substrate-binding protein
VSSVPGSTARTSRRRLAAGVAAVAGAALVLSACGGGGTSSGSSSSSASGASGGKVKMVFWNNANQEPGLSFYKKVIADYQAKNPNVTIENVPLQSEDMKAKLQVAMQSPNPPDIIHQWGGGWMKEQVEAGKLMDMTDATKDYIADLGPGAAGWQLDGKTYGVPFTLGVVGFWYRKDLFAQAGISNPPATLQELLDDAGKLKAKGIEPIAVGAKDKWPTAFWYDYLAVRECSKDTLQNAVKDVKFDDACWTKAAQDFQKIIDAKPFAKGFLGASAQQGAGSSAGQLANGKAAMELMGQWNAGVMQGLTPDKKPVPADKLGWFPFPTVDGATGLNDGGMGGGDGYSCSAKAPKECADFLKYFTSAEVQSEYTKVTSNLPVNKGASAAVTDPNLKAVLDARDKSSFVQLYLDVAFGSDVGNALNDAVSLQLAGSAKPDQVVKAISDAAASK